MRGASRPQTSKMHSGFLFPARLVAMIQGTRTVADGGHKIFVTASPCAGLGVVLGILLFTLSSGTAPAQTSGQEMRYQISTLSPMHPARSASYLGPTTSGRLKQSVFGSVSVSAVVSLLFLVVELVEIVFACMSCMSCMSCCQKTPLAVAQSRVVNNGPTRRFADASHYEYCQ